MHQGGAEADHQPAQQNGGEDAPDQHPVLGGERDAQRRQDDRDDEHVVHRQRLFDHEAGDVFLGRLGPEIPPDPAAEGEPEAEVERREEKALLHADLVLLVAMEKAEIEGEEGRDKGVEAEPHPDRLAEPFDVQKIDHVRDRDASFARKASAPTSRKRRGSHPARGARSR